MTKQDAQYLAQTVTRLERNRVDGRNPIMDALALHRIAGSLHRYDERICSEEMSERETARIEKRVENLEVKARDIATAYGFRAYFQGDCRGCPLYLIPETVVPIFGIDQQPEGTTVEAHHARLQADWIDSHYPSVGHAVPWLG